MRWFLRAPCKRGPDQAALALRADRGFYSKEVVQWGEAPHVRFSLTADQTAPLLALIAAMPDHCWTTLPDYPLCEVTELRSQPARWRKASRYVVKRQLTERQEGELSGRDPVCVTNEAATPAPALEGWPLQHAALENRIQDHKSGLGVERLPTGRLPAPWAYLLRGQLAVNLLAWVKKLGLPSRSQPTTLKPLRHHRLK